MDNTESIITNEQLDDAQIKRYKEKSMHQYIKCGRITGRPIDNHKSRIPGQETEQVLEIRKDEKTNCLSTVQKDNVLVYELPHGYNKSGIKEKNKFNTLRECTNYNYSISEDGVMWRKLTPIECERLQTVPDNYTNHVSNRQRYKMLGNGWTVDVIVHIFKEMFQTNIK